MRFPIKFRANREIRLLGMNMTSIGAKIATGRINAGMITSTINAADGAKTTTDITIGTIAKIRSTMKMTKMAIGIGFTGRSCVSQEMERP